MNEGIHKVVLYFNKSEMEFTVTTRMDRARLSGVDEQMSEQGWTRELVAEGLDKDAAEFLKAELRTEWEWRGFSYHTRPPLS
jgi:hypothetical protein